MKKTRLFGLTVFASLTMVLLVGVRARAQSAGGTEQPRVRHLLAPEADAELVRLQSLAGYEVVRIADTRTSMPGGFRRFTRFGVPSIDGRTVAFRADGEGGEKGIYAHTADGLKTIADLDTAAPGASGNFTFFTSLSLHGDVSVASDGSAAFFAHHADGRGVYANVSGVLTRLVDETFPVPGNPGGSFANIFHISYDGGRVAFTAVSEGFVQGLYFADGSTVSLIADVSTPIPGGTGTFDDFGLSSNVGNPSLHGDEVVFVGSGPDRQSGVYLASGGLLSVLADQTTLIPETTQTFPPFAGGTDVRDGEVVFNNNGIYVVRDSAIELVADDDTRIPGGFGLRFTRFGPPAIDNGKAVFQGEASFTYLQYLFILLKTGVYTDLQGPLASVAARSLFDRVDRKIVKEIFSGAEGLSDGVFAFKATFFNGSEGIYVARPE